MKLEPTRPSPLETDLLAVLHELYGDRGFPAPSKVRVLRRENTGSGRYVDLDPLECPQLDDGYLDLAGRFVDMRGIPNGLMAVARIQDHRLLQLEISVYGNDPWDGVEHEWKIV
jgi:hypothetical protein